MLSHTYTVFSGHIGHDGNIIGNSVLHQALAKLHQYLLLYLTCEILVFCNSKLVYRQRPRVLKHQVPIPPSPVKLYLRERIQRAPRPSQSDIRQHHHLHLVQYPQSK